MQDKNNYYCEKYQIKSFRQKDNVSNIQGLKSKTKSFFEILKLGQYTSNISAYG